MNAAIGDLTFPSVTRVMKKSSALSVLRHPGAFVRFLRDREAPVLPRLFVLFALIYVISPVDLVPDAIPLLGWLDDLGVFSLALAWAARQAARYEDEHPALPRDLSGA